MAAPCRARGVLLAGLAVGVAVIARGGSLRCPAPAAAHWLHVERGHAPHLALRGGVEEQAERGAKPRGQKEPMPPLDHGGTDDAARRAADVVGEDGGSFFGDATVRGARARRKTTSAHARRSRKNPACVHRA